MSHPLLQGPNIDAVLEMPRRVGMAEFMEKLSLAIRTSGTSIGSHAPVREFLDSDALAAIQLRTPGNTLQFVEHVAIGPAGETWENRILRAGLRGLEFSQQSNELLRHRDFALIPI